MNKIPPKLREAMAEDPFYEKCCLQGHACSGRIEWHHSLIYGGKQLQEKFAIVPLCKFHHRYAEQKDIKVRVMSIVLNRATDDELRAISKAVDYIALRNRINEVNRKTNTSGRPRLSDTQGSFPL